MKRILALENPELVLEWSENNELSPMDVTIGSHKKVWWKGKCGHEWEAIIKNRVNGSGCPYCSGNKVLKGFNDLATLFPDIAAEWSEKNYPLKPDMVTTKSNKIIIWRCKENHEWKAKIADRTVGHGCPICSIQIRNNETLVKLFRRLGLEMLLDTWSEKNIIQVNRASGSYRKMYYWECRRCGRVFRTSVGNLVKGAVCPSCRKADSEKRYQELLERRKLNRSKRFRLPAKAFEYYAFQVRLAITKDDDRLIGIPFQYFLPKYRVAIEFSDQRDYMKQHRRNNEVKNDLCLRTQIKMIRILDSNEDNYRNCLCISRVDDSYEGISESLQALFGILHIKIDIDVERDINYIRGFHLDSTDVK